MHIDDLRGLHTGRPGYVVGNGPSLRDVDLSRLAGEVTIGCNRGFLAEGGRWRPTYWTVEDPLDWQQFYTEFAHLEGSLKLVPDDLGTLPGGVRFPFRRDEFGNRGDGRGPQFAIDGAPFYWGATVSYLMLQIAAYLGCRPIYMLGHDFSWNWTNTVVGEVVTVTLDTDDNHFDPTYWPKGARSFAPVPGLMTLAFESARDVCAAAGIDIINLTAGSKLATFPMGDGRWLLR